MNIEQSVLSATPTVTMNHQTNTLLGLDNSMMISRDGGHFWEAYNEYYYNYFPGSPLVMVAKLQELALISEDYDPNKTYNGGDVVRLLDHYWTAQWWVDQGISPSTDSVWLDSGKVDYEFYGTFQCKPYTGKEASDIQNKGKAAAAAQRKVIGYFPEWGVYEAHNYFTPDKIDFTKLTHLNYGFAIVAGGQVIVHDTVKGPTLLRQLAKLTKTHGVTSMLSVGGWTNSADGVFEAATATAAGIEKLAESMVSFMRSWDFDGLDVDWEYPDNNTEKANFTTLIQKLRTKLDLAGAQDDKYYQLSAAVTTNHKNIQYINPTVTAPLLDSVNVMAYDIHGAFDAQTGHNAPLFANSKDADPLLNVSSAMQEYCVTWGVPKYKLMMGIPFYGRGWGNVAATEVVKGLPGLFCNGSATVHGAWDDANQYTGTNPYYVLVEKLAHGGFTRYWDDESKVAYLYNHSTKEFLNYDDGESIKAKVNYINEQGFGGAIIWDISGDDSEYTLSTIVSDVMNTKTAHYDTPAVNLFTENAYAGNVFKATRDIPRFADIYDNAGQSIENTISSATLDTGSLGYFVYSDENYLGDQTRVSANVSTYGSLYNDKCSSMRMIKAIGYRDENCLGQQYYFIVDVPDLSVSDYDGVMSSIKVLPGYVVRLFEGKGYTGAYRDISGSPFGINLADLTFDNRVNSVKVVCMTSEAKSTFYTDTNFKGSSLSFIDDLPSLGGVENSGNQSALNTISSATVPAGTLGYMVYTGVNYTGSSTPVGNNLASYNATYNNHVSSIRLIKAIGYSAANLSGRSVNFVDNVPDFAAINFAETMSSIQIDKDYVVRLYQNVNYGGKYLDITGTHTGLNIATLKMDFVASSLKIVKK